MNILSGRGRINRLQFLIWTVAVWIVAAIVFAVFRWNIAYFAGALGEGLISLLMSSNLEGLVFVSVFLCISFLYMRLRFHDINQRSWPYWVCMLIPAGYLVSLIYLLARKGTSGANRFGEKPVIRWPGFGVSACAVNSTSDDAFYQQAYEELENGQMDKALWAKIFSQCGGNENKAKALYIRSRVELLRPCRSDAPNKPSAVQNAWQVEISRRDNFARLKIVSFLVIVSIIIVGVIVQAIFEK